MRLASLAAVLVATTGCGLFKPVRVAEGGMQDALEISTDAMMDTPLADIHDVAAEDDQAEDVRPETCTPPPNDDLVNAIQIFTTSIPPGGQSSCIVDGGTEAGADSAADASDATVDAEAGVDASDVMHADVADVVDSSDVGAADAGDAGIPLPQSTYTIHNASTVCGHHSLDVPCDSASGGADVFYSFTLTMTEIVYADTIPVGGGMPAFRTILFFADGAGHVLHLTGQTTCDVQASCGTQGSQIAAVLQPGTYYLGLSGVGNDTGMTDVHLRFLPVDRGNVVQLAAGAQTINGSITSTEGGLFPVCNAAGHGAADTYWWATCPSPMANFTASACSSTFFYYAEVALRSADAGDICATSNSSCGFAGGMLSTFVGGGPGLYALYVAGLSCRAAGNYTLMVNRP